MFSATARQRTASGGGDASGISGWLFASKRILPTRGPISARLIVVHGEAKIKDHHITVGGVLKLLGGKLCGKLHGMEYAIAQITLGKARRGLGEHIADAIADIGNRYVNQAL